MAQFLLTELLWLSTFGSNISNIFQQIFYILVPILLQINILNFLKPQNILHSDNFEGSCEQKTTIVENQKICIL